MKMGASKQKRNVSFLSKNCLQQMANIQESTVADTCKGDFSLHLTYLLIDFFLG